MLPKRPTPVVVQDTIVQLPTPATPALEPAVERRPAPRLPVRRAVATEFFSLVPGPALAVDEPRLMRVRLPRAVLRSFGLPIDEERAAERILADVLVGEDGTAQAVRFVSSRSDERPGTIR